ncbi:hypothetical protein C8J57DRAFT_1294566 [Mycena rebaudengoi]|nr:hypothetical protein C8J57DRAFT_1294566 [Mycena rebaudengoi]
MCTRTRSPRWQTGRRAGQRQRRARWMHRASRRLAWPCPCSWTRGDLGHLPAVLVRRCLGGSRIPHHRQEPGCTPEPTAGELGLTEVTWASQDCLLLLPSPIPLATSRARSRFAHWEVLSKCRLLWGTQLQKKMNKKEPSRRIDQTCSTQASSSPGRISPAEAASRSASSFASSRAGGRCLSSRGWGGGGIAACLAAMILRERGYHSGWQEVQEWKIAYRENTVSHCRATRSGAPRMSGGGGSRGSRG